MIFVRFATGLLFFAFSSVSWTFAQESSPESTTQNLFLKEVISVTNDTGVLSLIPGTPVTRCGRTQDGAKVRTPDGTVIEVKESQLTSDRAEGEKLARREALSQAAIQSHMAKVLEQQRIDSEKKAELLNQTVSRTVSQGPDSSANVDDGLKRTPIQYEPVRANVIVHPPTFNKKKKKSK